MNRNEFINYVQTAYGVKGDNPWQKDPESTVFRHIGNRKWFAIVMRVKRSSLGLNGEELIDIVNFKCDKVMVGSALGNKGFYPAYHMNKENWITLALDERVPDEKLRMLVDMSYELTRKKIRRKNK